MKRLTILLISGVLLFGAAACDSARTSTNAPVSTQDNPEAPEAEEARQNKEDATDEVRRKQLNSDIRANEERNNAFNEGSATDRDDDSIASEVRSKLEANLPASALVVEAEDGTVSVGGTVPTQEQYDRIETLAKEIKGVQAVNVKVKVAPAKPEGS
ncbi:MAG TPA: transporter [Cyanobacteria bacterium UBA12227]|nr:transporter [Cyanobacteria bacterium UBA12227]HAX88967.1 transporter [Cyanobacteria bacterium UBA11370]HBY77977.1 transporter [Cyanobacteria bacterium UBA11148]